MPETQYKKLNLVSYCTIGLLNKSKIFVNGSFPILVLTKVLCGPRRTDAETSLKNYHGPTTYRENDIPFRVLRSPNYVLYKYTVLPCPLVPVIGVINVIAFWHGSILGTKNIVKTHQVFSRAPSRSLDRAVLGCLAMAEMIYVITRSS